LLPIQELKSATRNVLGRFADVLLLKVVIKTRVEISLVCSPGPIEIKISTTKKEFPNALTSKSIKYSLDINIL